MALLVEKATNIMGGIAIPEIYMRFDYKVNVGGKTVLTNILKYASREAYLEDSMRNNLYIPELKDSYGFEYDRELEGDDVLTVIHDKYKEFLSTDITKEVPVIDPSTGEPERDPSTGKIITHTVIVTPKFAMDTSIFIVDIDPSVA